jgi:hypothetical protein
MEIVQSKMPESGVYYYVGTWQSDNYLYAIAHGSVLAEVDFKTKSAKIHLRYEGMFQRGRVKVMETTMEGNTALAHTYVFTLKGSARQNLKFTADKITAREINGNYTSANPIDKGKFTLANKPKPEYDAAINSQLSCSIM